MIVYLAAAWSKREQMKALAIELEKIPGLIVNSRWIKEDAFNTGWSPRKNAQHNREPKHMEKGERSIRAEQDRADVQAADILVRFTDDLSQKMVPSYLATGSRMWEMGYAMRGHQPVIVVGGFQNFFDYLPEVQHVKTVTDLKRTLRRIASGEKLAHKKSRATLRRALQRMELETEKA